MAVTATVQPRDGTYKVSECDEHIRGSVSYIAGSVAAKEVSGTGLSCILGGGIVWRIAAWK